LRAAAALGLAGALAGSVCAAQTEPLWELGAGVAGLKVPHYRGSDQSSNYLLPVPYLIYRGEVFKADRSGLSTALFDSKRTHLSLSVNGTLPVNSTDNTARRGMADLKPAIEVGPTLDFDLWQSDDRKVALDFRAPLRAAFSVQSSPSHIGWLFYPNLHVRVRDPAGLPGWRLAMTAGPQFTDRKYNSYFYSVSPADATAARPAYSAAGGYGGTQVGMTLSKRFSRYWVGSFVRYDGLDGAVYESSPLVKRRDGLSAGVAISWIFGQSAQRVKPGDED
jgi:outer membrane protein